jgi:arginase
MKKSITFISVPFDSAHFNTRMGAGPRHVLKSGIIQNLRKKVYEIHHTEIIQKEAFPTEVTSTFTLLKLLKEEVRKAIQNQSFPIVLSGNCCATVAVMAEMNPDTTGVIWFDAHGDCETPETTASGFLDGMGMSMLLNRCWQNLLSTFDLNTTLPGKNILLVGARDLSNDEYEFISANNITLIPVDDSKQLHCNPIKTACAQFTQAGIQRIHLHIDVDVIDPSIAGSNAYSVLNGLSKNELVQAIDCCIGQIPLASLTIASYDPSFDQDDRMLWIIHELIETVLTSSPTPLSKS